MLCISTLMVWERMRKRGVVEEIQSKK